MPGIRKNMCDMIKKYMAAGALLVPAVLICFPVFLILTGSVMDGLEMKAYLAPVFGDGEGYIRWKLMPDYPSFANYGKLLFMTPQFFVLFWNSMRMTACILAGQILVGVPAAWAFAVYRVKGSKILFALYVILMLLPFQVTMLSSYLVLNRLSLLNTQQAIILPAIFSTFPVFLSYGGFKSIPYQILEAARVDGANDFIIWARIVLPLCKPVLATVALFMAVGQWNSFMDTYLYAKELPTLQYVLYEIMEKATIKIDPHAAEQMKNAVSPLSVRMAITIIATVPIIIVYPFLQKYFVGGMTVGAVKD